jgi:hypothetical protein
MKNLILKLIFCFALFSCNSSSEKKENPLKVGVSKAVITPKIGSFIAGDKQDRHFTGVLDDLYAKAMVVYDGNTAFALVTVDCIGLLYSDLLKIREAASKLDYGIPFPPENIVISSTHTHAGPDVVGIWGKDYSQSGVDPEYMEFLINTVVKQIQIASNNMLVSHLVYGETEYGHEWVGNICNEEIDRSVTVLQFQDKEGNNIVSLTNFACHPTYLDAIYSEVSGDYIAGFYQEMENELGGEHLFLQGAIGGWIQPLDKGIDYQETLERGKGLAKAAIRSLDKPTPLLSKKLDFSFTTLTLPVENQAWQQLAAAGIFQRELTDVVESEIAWFSIGEATFATHPGETAPIFGLETKELMQDGPKFILGLSQDAMGYILKPEYFDDPNLPHASYLTRMSLGRNTGPLIMEELKNLSKE